MARRGAIEMVAGVTIGAGKLTRAILQALGLPVGRIGLAQVGNEEIAEVPWSKMIGGLCGAIVMKITNGGLLASENYSETSEHPTYGVALTGAGQIKSPGFMLQPEGYITIGAGVIKLTINAEGAFQFSTDAGGPFAGVEQPNGRIYIGGTSFATAIATFDEFGNFRLRNTATTNHQIDLGAISFSGVVRPTASPAGGHFDASVNVYLLEETQSADVYYTVDGSTPDNTKTFYDGTPIVISADTTLKVIAFKANVYSPISTYTFTKNGSPGDVVPNTIFRPVGGSYSPTGGNLTVDLTNTMPGSSIRYTTDGVTVPSSTVGTLISPASGLVVPNGSFVLAVGTRVVKAISFKSGSTPSDVLTETYEITNGGGGGGGTGGGGGGGGGGPWGRGAPP